MIEPRDSVEPPPRWLLAALALAALLHVAAFAGFVPGNDWTRDLVAAFAIADGEGFPSRGPVINASAHLGPVWYWLLALPLALGAGFTGTALFVGVLSTLKVPLAWRLGSRLGGPWLGVSFAALMLLPGWDLLHSLQLTHTVMLEALLIAAWLPLLALWRDGHARHWAVFGVLGGLAVHAHPVALALFVPAAVVAWRRRACWRGDIAWVLGGLLLAMLPLLPMLLAEAREGWPGLQALREAADSPAPADHTTILQLPAALTAGAWNILHAWLPPAYAWMAGIGMLGAVVISVAGVGSLHRGRTLLRVFGASAALVVIALAWLLAVRYRTPFYMLLLAWPPLMLLAAAPLAALAARGGAARAAALLAIAFALASSVAGTIGLLATTRSGHAELPLPAIGDVRLSRAPGVRVALMPIHAFDGLARASCREGTLRVHGELAALIDFYHGIPFRWLCPQLTVQLMGGDGDGVHHWAGMTPHTLRLLGHDEASWKDAWSLAPARVIAPPPAVPLVSGYRYPHREVASTQAEVRAYTFDAGPDEAVAVYSPLFPFDVASTPQARCDGVPVVPLSSTNAGALFVPPHQGSGCAWEITLESRVPGQVDIIALPIAGATGPPR